MATHVFGKPIKRREDPAFLQGSAPFIADMSLPHMAHIEILRSPHAHAIIKSRDISEAEKMPGVVKIIRCKDIIRRMKPLASAWVPGRVGSHFPLHAHHIP